MKTKFIRFSLTLLAFGIGMLLVWGLTKIGDETKGPMSDVLKSTGETVTAWEEQQLLNKRSGRRKDKLAWLENYKRNPHLLKEPRHRLLGIYDNLTTESLLPITEVETKIETTFPLIHMYVAWGSNPEHQFPKKQLHAIQAMGSIPVITWEPWLSAFEGDGFEQLPAKEHRDFGSLKAIAEGHYDAYIQTWAEEAAAWNAPIFLRFAHEMNDPYRYPWGPQNNKPEDFVAAWKHVHAIFLKAQAHQVLWVWSPHQAYGYLPFYYPGDSLVDWLGLGVLNYGTAASWSTWWSFEEIFGNYYPELIAFRKPIMITEFGCLTVGGNRSHWLADALRSIPLKYKQVKSLLFFHHRNDNTITGNKMLDWAFDNDPESLDSVREVLPLWTKAH